MLGMDHVKVLSHCSATAVQFSFFIHQHSLHCLVSSLSVIQCSVSESKNIPPPLPLISCPIPQSHAPFSRFEQQ